MKNKILILMIGMIFFISMVSAVSYIGKQYEDINITEICVVDGFPCPNDYLCNISINDPELNLIVLNSPMTRNDTTYNYTFVSTDLLGDYAFSVQCANNTRSGVAESNLKITTTGREPNAMITILLLLSSLGVFILAVYLKNHAVGFISGILFTISGMYLMIYGLGNISDLYTRAIAYIVIAFGSFVVLVSGYEWLDDLES